MLEHILRVVNDLLNENCVQVSFTISVWDDDDDDDDDYCLIILVCI